MKATYGAIALFLVLRVASGAEPLQAVLGRMDREAQTFSQMTAKLTNTSYMKVLDDTTIESGAIWLKKSGDKIEVRGEIIGADGADARSFGFRGNEGQMYYPKMNTVEIYDLGKSRGLIDELLLLGFGGSGRQLEKNYAVKVAGEDTIGGQKTTRLELVPKSKKVAEQIERVDLWIPFDAGHPVRQKFYKRAGNYTTVAYSDIKLNPGLPGSEFALKLPAKVTRVYPQK